MRALFLLTLLLGIATSATASMILDRAIVTFAEGGPSRQDVVINNPDAEPLYVKVEVLEVVNPGAENEERNIIDDPKAKRFLATPNKLIIPPGGRKQVRLVNIGGHEASEKVFRVNFVPVEAADEPVEQMGVKILIGYQVLVLVDPIKSYPELQGSRTGTTASLTNAGNTNIFVRSLKQCPTDDAHETECVELPGRRLYPGNQWTVDLPMDRPVEASVTMGNKNKNVVFE